MQSITHKKIYYESLGSEPEGITGDLNSEGKIDIADAVMVLNLMAEQ